jgi:hypothetical protein
VFRSTPYEIERYCDQDDLNRIAAAYDLLWDTVPPMLSPDQRAAADATAQHARKVGWAPPLAYDDDESTNQTAGPRLAGDDPAPECRVMQAA